MVGSLFKSTYPSLRVSGSGRTEAISPRLLFVGRNPCGFDILLSCHPGLDPGSIFLFRLGSPPFMVGSLLSCARRTSPSTHLPVIASVRLLPDRSNLYSSSPAASRPAACEIFHKHNQKPDAGQGDCAGDLFISLIILAHDVSFRFEKWVSK
jgi:hypothetical protein